MPDLIFFLLWIMPAGSTDCYYYKLERQSPSGKYGPFKVAADSCLPFCPVWMDQAYFKCLFSLSLSLSLLSLQRQGCQLSLLHCPPPSSPPKMWQSFCHVTHPTNSALLINFLLSSDAEILSLSTDWALQSGGKTCKNVYTTCTYSDWDSILHGTIRGWVSKIVITNCSCCYFLKCKIKMQAVWKERFFYGQNLCGGKLDGVGKKKRIQRSERWNRQLC